ncbi:hypothetical protein ARZXY2_1219 [Arthrobacter sp. ZXY-2]|nr:hypothetical protein ARZXY2_1219 [Arthrobacter sp. ZXY-2]
METAPLKSFATWARIALIREVSARISVVLASEELRQEQPTAVAALNKAVNAAGGSDKGRDTVADKVAYTWFNRIIALRFMDAKAYTGIGVVSPERGREGGQPEILAEAKRGNIDGAVVTNKRTIETVTSLLNGTRRSNDPQGEAYALLLAEYCRHWNRSMPFMFEREGDYTELLIPGNLLADDSVLARAARVLTEDVCQDVEVIGWLYQFYISARKDEVFAGFKKNKKATAKEIPAATQLFTPHWIVKYLVENSLGRLWLLNNPGSRLAEQMEYYIAPLEPETDFLKIRGPEELRVLDPACGSGHMLTYAFDLLYLMYEESGYARSDIPSLILQHNLFGAEIDPRAGALAAFALSMKARGRQRTFLNQGKGTAPNICVLEPVRFAPDELETLMTRGGDNIAEEAFWQAFNDADTFGSLIRPDQALLAPMKAHLASLGEAETLFGEDVLGRAWTVIRQAEYLSTRYQVVVANPPYMGSGNMGQQLAEFAKREYPDSKSDLFAMFIERGLELVEPSAYLAMVTMQSWMFISSYKVLRQKLMDASTLKTLVHMDNMVMGIAFGTAAAVWTRFKDPSWVADYSFVTIRDIDNNEPKEFPVRNERLSRKSQSDFSAIPGNPIAYWLPSTVIRAFATFPLLSTEVVVTGGMTTGDNDRFLRRWFEVSDSLAMRSATTPSEALSSGKKWFPYNKGGEYRKWFGNREYYVNWKNSGEEILSTGRAYPRSRQYYFRESLTYTATSSSYFGIRYSDPGSIFDAKGSSCFVSQDKIYGILGYLASKPVSYLLKALNPTIEFQTGDLMRLPLVPISGGQRVQELVEISRQDLSTMETDPSFSRPGILRPEAIFESVTEAFEGWIKTSDEWVSRSRALEEENNRSVASVLEIEDLIESSVKPSEITLSCNPAFALGKNSTPASCRRLQKARSIEDLISYAVGCMFGRYSLDEPGLIVADQGGRLQDYLTKIPSPKFMPDRDNVIPVVDGDWFEDDIVARFRQFLRVAFGEAHFEENLRFVTDALGVKDLRDYFVKSFYKDHVQRYKKRPIYWLFSSPKGSFNALIYMHRYTPSTASTVLNEYLREFKAKLDASRQHLERLAVGNGSPREKAAAQKEVDRLRNVVLELDEYEHDVLYPLATQQVQIDLDDGVKANYPKLGAALKKIPGLEASDE